MNCVDLTIFISILMFSSHGLYDGSMGRQQKLFLLWLYLGEQGHNFSHTLHDVVGVGGGTIMEKMGYSLALNVQEVLPSWEGPLICSSIMVNAFDIVHVKEWSYELARAYLHGPTML